MSKGKIYKKVRLSEKSEIRLSKDYWDYKEWVSFRLWTKTKDGWIPTKRGVGMKPEIAEEFFKHLMKEDKDEVIEKE